MTTPVVFICDETYAVGLAAALRSVVQHTLPLPQLLVIDTGLSQCSRHMLDQVGQLQWIDARASPAAQQLAALLPAGATTAYPSASCWLKLVLPDLLPPGLSRILYMDCDMLALSSLHPALETDLQGHMLAAARDVGYPCGPPELAAAGWPAGTAYFNTGLLLLDLPKLHAAGGRARQLLAKHGASLRFHDQDLLNLLAADQSPSRQATGTQLATTADGCRTEAGSAQAALPAGSTGGPYAPAGSATSSSHRGWLELGLEWNAQGVGTYARSRVAGEPGCPPLFGSAEQLRRYEQHPAVVHFTGPPSVAPSAYLNPWVPYVSKPWAYLCQHPHRAAFFSVLDGTPWRGWRPAQRQVAEACAAEVLALCARIETEAPGFSRNYFLLQLLCRLAGRLVSDQIKRLRCWAGSWWRRLC